MASAVSQHPSVDLISSHVKQVAVEGVAGPSTMKDFAGCETKMESYFVIICSLKIPL